MAQTTKKAAKKATATKKKAAAKKAPAKKAAAERAPVKKKAPAKTAATVPAPAEEAPAKKASAKKRAPAKKKAPTKESPAKSPFSKSFLAAQREALIEERATYLGQAESLKAEADSLVADVDPGDVQFDEESGEGDSLAIERDRDLALSAQARQAVDEIDHALSKFELGTYGICEVSGDSIPEERLDAIPWARQRVEHKIGGLGRR